MSMVNPAQRPQQGSPLTSARSPLTSAQQFVTKNPQFIGGMTSRSTRLLPSDSMPGLQRGRNSEVSLVQQTNYRRMDNVKASADRIRQIGEAARQRRAEEAAERERATSSATSQVAVGDQANNYVQGASVRGAGKAWQADGKLSKSRNALLQNASSYLGTPYVLGGRSYKGIDCSGLVMSVYNKFGFNITQHHAGVQGRTIPGVRTGIKNLRPGDIVAWKDGSHIAIYAGNGEIIEAPNPRRGTVRRKLWANPDAVFGIAVRLPGE